MNKPVRILYLEDEANLEEVVKLYLQKENIKADLQRAANRTEFETAISTHEYDLFILDRVLKDIDGIDAISLVRNINPHVPIIMLSGTLDEKLIVKALQSGANDYVLKQNIDRLGATIKNVLHQSNQHENTYPPSNNDDRFQDIIDNLPGGVYQFKRNKDGSYCLPCISTQFQKLMGVNDNDVQEDATLAFDKVHPDDIKAMLDSIEVSAASLKKWEYEFRVQKDNGDYLWIKGISTPRLQQDGSIIWSGILLDIHHQKNIENALRKSESNLRAILDNMLETFYRTDLDGQLIMVSPSVFELIGYKPDEILGKKLADFYYEPNGREQFLKALADNNGTVINYEAPLKDKNGHAVWVSTCATYYKDLNGDIAGVEGTTRNITKRHEAEIALQQSHHELEVKVKQRTKELEESHTYINSVLENIIDGIITIDIKGTIRTINPAVTNIFGYTKNELVGQNIKILMPEPFYSEHDIYLKNYSEGGTPNILGKGREVSGKRKNGEVFPLDLSVAEIHLDGDHYFMGMVKDITERVKIEKALKTSELRYEQSQTYANIGTWDWNIQTGDLYWSDRIAPLFGYPKGKLETTYENFLASVHPDDQQDVIDAVTDCVEKGIEYNIEHRCVWPDGTERWLLEKGDVSRAEDGTPLHMLGVVQDITERKEAQESAIQANKAKSDFLSSMSHELRTPLNAILGFSQLLEMDETLNNDQHDNIFEINKAGHHLLDLINEILDLSKIEAGHIELTLENINLRNIIQECLLLIRNTADQQDITIVADYAEDKPDLIVVADNKRLKQVILNLLSNAVKYNKPNGKIFVNYAQSDNNKITITVRDTGKGISPEQLSNMFSPFNRLGAENSNIQGTGIGLVITKMLVEYMDGQLNVESQLNEGSAFSFTLNTSSSGQTIPGSNTPLTINTGINSMNTDKTIIYIEDNPTNLKLVEQLIKRKQGINLLSATEPESGLELINQQIPDLILLDINLPGMSGFELLEIIKNNPLTSHIPVIAVSANAMTSDLEKGQSAGFNSYITKPIDIQNFYGTLEQYLN